MSLTEMAGGMGGLMNTVSRVRNAARATIWKTSEINVNFVKIWKYLDHLLFLWFIVLLKDVYDFSQKVGFFWEHSVLVLRRTVKWINLICLLSNYTT